MAATRSTPSPQRGGAHQGRLGRRLFLIALMLIVGFLVVDGLVGERGVVALMQARRQQAVLANDVALKLAQNSALRERVRRLTSDPSAIEEIARRELGLIKPGERLFIIRDLDAARQAQPPSQPQGQQ